MNIFKSAWIDYCITYILFVGFWSLARSFDPLFYLPTLLFAFYVYLSSNNWLFETRQARLYMAKMIASSGLGTNKNGGLVLVSAYSVLWTMVYFMAFGLSTLFIDLYAFWRQL